MARARNVATAHEVSAIDRAISEIVSAAMIAGLKSQAVEASTMYHAGDLEDAFDAFDALAEDFASKGDDETSETCQWVVNEIDSAL